MLNKQHISSLILDQYVQVYHLTTYIAALTPKLWKTWSNPLCLTKAEGSSTIYISLH